MKNNARARRAWMRSCANRCCRKTCATRSGMRSSRDQAIPFKGMERNLATRLRKSRGCSPPPSRGGWEGMGLNHDAANKPIPTQPPLEGEGGEHQGGDDADAAEAGGC